MMPYRAKSYQRIFSLRSALSGKILRLAREAEVPMTPLMRWFGPLLVMTLPIAVSAQPNREATVIFKDGFAIKGTVNEKIAESVFDPASGRSFPIFSGEFYIDDHVRNVMFSPHQVTKVYQPKEGEVKKPMMIKRYNGYFQDLSILKEFQFEKFEKWGENGERTVTVLNTTAQLKGAKEPRIYMKQKVALVTPHYIKAITEKYIWDQMYFTDEFGPELTRKILLTIFNERKDLKERKDAERLIEIAGFMQQAGWFKEAERDLKAIIEIYPKDDAKKTAEDMLAKLYQEKANLYVENIERAANVGQHAVTVERLAVYERAEYQKLIRPKLSIMAADLKAKYAKAKTEIGQAKAYLKELPALTMNESMWKKATDFILDELNPDTLDRLDTFLLFAQQHEMDRKKKKQPGQTAEEVLALAVSGWLQGKQAAEPDVKAALKLAKGREFLVEYLTTESSLKRTSLLSAFLRDNELPIDVMGRLIRMIPPVEPHDAKALGTAMQTLKIGAGAGGSYHLQLPPDYHHQRAYPVLILLASSRDTADETLQRFAEEAAKQGIILVAPQLAAKKGKGLSGAKQQQLVLDTLSDLRRRFQIDSDRVFLFGWEDGGGLAFDVGLGHPDLFAGVAPMNGVFTPFTKRYYWPNAQYLPFYIIDGERNGGNARLMRDLMKDWTRIPYNAIYVEYKGRGSEWYGLEVPKVLDWMSRKKRYSPLKEMGRANSGTTLGEEFHSTRDTDNRFYWLSCESIAPRCLADHTEPKPATFRPATFQANLSVGNQLEKGVAKIWNQADLRVSGVNMKKLTFWITPGMMDLSKPLLIRVNGNVVGKQRMITPSLETMLEELYRTGDRQRLFVAKIDL
jgi:pimeloyl-ACP methyl ester carboxylesterase